VSAPVEAISLPFAAPLALFLPGCALTAAIFARRRLDGFQFLILSFGLSLATLALGALLLNYAPGGIRPLSWALLLWLITAGACRAAALRRTAQMTGVIAWPRLWPGRAAASLLGGALLAAGAALALAFVTTSAKNADGYTALWLLPPGSHGTKAGGARIGISSQEQKRTAYRLRVRVGDGRSKIVHDFSLDPGQTRIVGLRPRPGFAGSRTPVKAVLSLRKDPGAPYRRVSGWLAKPGESR
jgi:uncharacterized membrane protein